MHLLPSILALVPPCGGSQPHHPVSPAGQLHVTVGDSGLQCVKKQQKQNFLAGLQKINHKVNKNVKSTKLSKLPDFLEKTL